MIKRGFFLSFVFGLIPSWFLYQALFGFFHNQAIWTLTEVSSRLYSGSSLKIDAFFNIVFYLGLILIISYFANSGEFLLGGKGSIKERVKNFFYHAFNPTTLILAFLVSIIYLPLVSLLNSGVNPW